MPLYVITAHAAVRMYSASTNNKLISRRDYAMLPVIQNFAESLKVT